MRPDKYDDTKRFLKQAKTEMIDRLAHSEAERIDGKTHGRLMIDKTIISQSTILVLGHFRRQRYSDDRAMWPKIVHRGSDISRTKNRII